VEKAGRKEELMFGQRQSTAKKVVAFPDTTDKDALADWQPLTDLSTEPGSEPSDNEVIERLVRLTEPIIAERIDGFEGVAMDRGLLANTIGNFIDEAASAAGMVAEEHDRRDAITVLLNDFLANARRNYPELAVVSAPAIGANACSNSVSEAKNRIQPILMEQIDLTKASALPRSEMAEQIGELVGEILAEERMQINQLEQRDLITSLLNDMLGLGPLEPLLADDKVTDIMVNGPKQVYVERGGKLELSDVTFSDDAHVMNIATRIVTQVGRRIDESTPLVDARLTDGSRVNIIVPPLAIDGPSISIRKFAKQKITLDVMERQKNLSPEMATVLKIAARCRLNILISGGTGSGKTTLLNAMSRMIDHGERIVTIEDAAELQLQQPHVVRLETRPPNLEGGGEITQRELVKNTLRMRPDRIILGEIRAGEALDMLQAMNTGHDGSMCTIHANRPREALTRLDNMVAMAGVKLPNEAVRAQIAGAVNLIVQISRMRDGVRRITQISEVMGMEGNVVTMQDLFIFRYQGEDSDGKLFGQFEPSGLRPHFISKAQYYGLDRALMEAVSTSPEVSQ
jgi:pilus assembly protein CpaF